MHPWRRTTGTNRTVIDRLAATGKEESVVQQGGRDAADDRTDPVDQVALEDAARDRGAEGARGVERRTGQRTDGEDHRGEREPDREAAHLRRLGVDRAAEDDEDEEECRDR